LLLLDAIYDAENAIQRMKDEAESQKWAMVTNTMRKRNACADYSMKSCRERYENIQNGTAIVPVELDDDPPRRRALAARKKTEYEAKLAKEAKEAEQAKIKKTTQDKLKARDSARKSRERRAARWANGGCSDEGDVASTATRPAHVNPCPDLFNGGQTCSDADEDEGSRYIPGRKGTFRAYEPKEISSLSRKAQLAMRAADVAKDGVTALRVDEDSLPDFKNMSRDDMRRELKGRGIKRFGTREELTALLAKARDGEIMPASALPADPSPFVERKKKPNLPSARSLQPSRSNKRPSHLTAMPPKKRAKRVFKSTERIPSESPEAPNSPMSLGGAFNEPGLVVRATDDQFRQRPALWSVPAQDTTMAAGGSGKVRTPERGFLADFGMEGGESDPESAVGDDDYQE
jgi:hypothetical protein